MATTAASRRGVREKMKKKKKKVKKLRDSVIVPQGMEIAVGIRSASVNNTALRANLTSPRYFPCPLD